MPPKYYCPQCHKIVETYVKETTEFYNVRNELDVTVHMPVRHCKVCDCDIYDADLDSKILDEVYRIYEEKTGRKATDYK